MTPLRYVDLYDKKIDLGPSPSKLAIKRWTGQMSPEPETVEWIESLPPGDIFFDIGASVGTHAIRAAVRGLDVYAFEPQPALYKEICATAFRNGLKMHVYPIAVHEFDGCGLIERGRSTATVNEDPRGGVKVMALDSLCEHVGCAPDHIKLDVDGNEMAILHGATKTLAAVKSMLVEVDPVVPGHAAIPEFLLLKGFHFNPAQVERDMIREGKYKGTVNYIFRRT